MLFRPRRWAMICCLVVSGALAGMPAAARENPQGTKNFVPPSSVPDHFSNEAEPFLGTKAVRRNEDIRPAASFAARHSRHGAARHVAARHIAARHIAARHVAARHVAARHVALRRGHRRGHLHHSRVAHHMTRHAVHPVHPRRHATAHVTRTASVHAERRR